MKIETLTKEQELKVQTYLNKWLNNGKSTKRLDKEKTITAVKTIYRCAKKGEPKSFFFFPSPLQCQLAIGLLKQTNLKEILKEKANLSDNLSDNLRANLRDNLANNLWDNLEANLSDNLRANLWDNLWDNLANNLGANLSDNLRANLRANLKTEFVPMFYGNIEWIIGWTGFYDFVLNELFEDRISEFKDFIAYLEAIKQVHVFLPYKDIVFISDRPTGLEVNKQGRLHSDLKPALHYSDGYSLFYLNGVRMPKELVLTKGEDLKTLEAIGEKNIDVRREALKKIPLEKIIKDTKAKVLDEWKNDANLWCDYVLYDMDFQDGKIRRVLKMKNPSVPDTVHFERVEDDIRKVKQALAWRNGQEDYLKPKKEFYEREQLT